MLNNYLTQLKNELLNSNIKDTEDVMDYIQEIINDRLESGEQLQDILDSLGQPEEIVKSLRGEDITFKKDDKEVINHNEIIRLEYDDVSDLNIENISFDYQIIDSDNEKTIVEYDQGDDKYLSIRYKNGRLSIEQEGMFDFGKFLRNRFVSKEKTVSGIIVYLPADKKADLDFENVSGRICISDLSFNKMEIESVSGLIQLNNLDCASLECESVSGSIQLTNCNIDRYTALENVSGSIKTEAIISPKISAETVSGSVNLNINDNSNDYDIEISGLMKDQKIKGNGNKIITIETVSGSIRYSFNQ